MSSCAVKISAGTHLVKKNFYKMTRKTLECFLKKSDEFLRIEIIGNPLHIWVPQGIELDII